MVEFRIVPEALDDLQQAVRWYDERSRHIGLRFRRAVKRTFDQVRRNPTATPVSFESFRIRLVRGFP